MSKIMTIRPPEEMQKRLKKLAKEYGVPLNAYVIQIFDEWLKYAASCGKKERRQQ